MKKKIYKSENIKKPPNMGYHTWGTRIYNFFLKFLKIKKSKMTDKESCLNEQINYHGDTHESNIHAQNNYKRREDKILQIIAISSPKNLEAQPLRII
ncbi:hypothetical protein BpHYR1_000455 [Brachionus plicatilis]|uniref:Uncharacterized protein n=1 Tax=Brachionus plicatilis TaxID=10195 RepID=A0A3M7RMJ7_BRAPC|nr:hypothetical protein BpHYR1_000455 [Brachionus plicatilis]